jgi:spermidine synthase
VVEINPHVIALRNEFHVPPDDDRMRVIHGDGAKYARHGTPRADVLMVDGFDSDGLPDELCSQRFYDDCREMLQPGGMLVVNLHYGHREYEVQLARIQRAFGDAVLVVDDGELSNSIVFASQGDALAHSRAGVVRPPKGLAHGAAQQLLGAFARVSRALKDRNGA